MTAPRNRVSVTNQRTGLSSLLRATPHRLTLPSSPSTEAVTFVEASAGRPGAPAATYRNMIYCGATGPGPLPCLLPCRCYGGRRQVAHRMRWRIRSQLLVPLLLLLLAVAGISTWTALASARRARRQIEERDRNVADSLALANFPLTDAILQQVKRLSGADYLLVPRQ